MFKKDDIVMCIRNDTKFPEYLTVGSIYKVKIGEFTPFGYFQLEASNNGNVSTWRSNMFKLVKGYNTKLGKLLYGTLLTVKK